MIKYRMSATAIAGVNPCFAFGGMAFDSKYDMISKFLAFPDAIAKTVLISKREIVSIIEQVKEANIDYPFICKPDKGHRGNGFKIIRSQADLENYINICARDFLIQEYIDYPLEYGVFWVKYPGEEKGRITSITRKVLPYLKGDGKSKLYELILSDKRARYLAKTYLEKNQSKIDSVIPKNESIRICSAGNHCQGAIFEDGMGDIKGNTKERLIEICSSISGFDFGRMDIKFKNKDSLENGSGFKILEVNGSEAESTHIYDRKYSIYYAYKTLYQQWDTLFAIARKNKEKGFSRLTIGALLKAYIEFFKESKEIKGD